jgi:hypothetical protein
MLRDLARHLQPGDVIPSMNRTSPCSRSSFPGARRSSDPEDRADAPSAGQVCPLHRPPSDDIAGYIGGEDGGKPALGVLFGHVMPLT